VVVVLDPSKDEHHHHHAGREFARVVEPLERATGRRLGPPARGECLAAFELRPDGVRVEAENALVDASRNPLGLFVHRIRAGWHELEPLVEEPPAAPAPAAATGWEPPRMTAARFLAERPWVRPLVEVAARECATEADFCAELTDRLDDVDAKLALELRRFVLEEADEA
jgi:hypothetical protein